MCPATLDTVCKFGTAAIVVMVENGDVTAPEILCVTDRLNTGISGTKNVVEVVNLATMVRKANLQASGRDHIPDDQSTIASLINTLPEQQREIVLLMHSILLYMSPCRRASPILR